jgi:cellulose synthase/poly-beta-1,6-N-acetylglucosamine synthase-like glycosyltransferase
MIDLVSIAVQIPLLGIALLFSAYLVVLTVASFVGSRKHNVAVPPKRRFAIIIPAHNEERGIAHTLQSIGMVSYPNELYDTIVVADNCTDRTAALALDEGAIVLERFDPERRGKGYALNWVIPQVLERMPGYDAFVFIDADSIMSPNFLDEMNRALQNGHRVIQSSDLVVDNPTSWRAQLTLVAFALYNYVRPLGKAQLGASTPLKGNGMCFAADVIPAVRWDNNALVEDLDLGLELVRRNIPIYFASRAKVYAVMPTTAEGATTQRMRWEGGRFNTIKTKVPSLLREAWRKRSLLLFEAALDATCPPIATFLMISLVFAGLNGLLVAEGWVTNSIMLIGWAAVVLGLALHAILGMMVARVHPRNLLALIYLPNFIVWKMGVYLKMAAGRQARHWVRTAR